VVTWPSRVIWTFVRDDELLQLRRVKRAEGFFVIERREGFPDRSFYFSDLTRLLIYEQELIAQLKETGWILVDFWPERRSGIERRRHNGRSGPDRRKTIYHPRPS
jgi:hypothetical protein